MDAPLPTCPSLERLDALAGGNHDPEVTVHLEACAECRARLAAIEADNELFDRLRSADLACADLHGTATTVVIPGYELGAEISRGGQGIVSRAIQVATRRTVAIKVLAAGAAATRRQRLRFERELDLVTSLRHPGIVTVYDSGTTADGRRWIAMEFVEGRPIDEWVERTSIGRDEIVRLIIRVGEAVAAAHRRGVIHRDLKPDNILVDADGEPRVLDFGLARAIDAEGDPTRHRLTVERGFMGTLAYAAPEQVQGEADRVDARCDVHAVGVILYELLTGRVPVDLDGRLTEVIHRIVSIDSPAASSVRPARFPVGRDLDVVIATALARDPDRRYQTIDALLNDLRHVLRDEPVEARRDSGWYVLGKTLHRHRLALAGLTAALLLLVVIAVAMTVLYRRARDETEKLARVNLFLEDTIGSVEARPGGGDVTVLDFLDEGVLWIDLVLRDDPETRASVAAILGNGYRNLGRYDDAERMHLEALAIRTALFGPESLEAAASLSGLGLLRRDQDRVDEAVSLFEEALVIRRRRLGEDHLSTAMARGNLALALREIDLERASALQMTLLRTRRRVLGDDHPDVAMACFTLAGMHHRANRLAEAESLHEEALEIRRARLDPAHPDLARSLVALGATRRAGGDADSALPLLVEAVERRRAVLPVGHASIAEAEVELARCRLDRGETAEAARLLDRAVPVIERERGAESPHARVARELRETAHRR